MTYTTTGKIIRIGKITTINSSFKKREVVITTEVVDSSSYAYMMLECYNADVNKTDGLKVDDPVSVSFTIHAKAYTPKTGGGTRYINNLRLSNIELLPNSIENTVPAAPTPGPVTAFDDMPDLQ